MNKKEFEELVEEIKIKNPKIFGLDYDRKPSIQELEEMEQYYSIVFPESYKDFLLQYGGGYFGFTTVYSLDESSFFYVKNNISQEFVHKNKFFPVIDLETGDLLGFKIENGICEDSIMLYNYEENLKVDMKINFYNALVEHGLK